MCTNPQAALRQAFVDFSVAWTSKQTYAQRRIIKLSVPLSIHGFDRPSRTPRVATVVCPYLLPQFNRRSNCPSSSCIHPVNGSIEQRVRQQPLLRISFRCRPIRPFVHLLIGPCALGGNDTCARRSNAPTLKSYICWPVLNATTSCFIWSLLGIATTAEVCLARPVTCAKCLLVICHFYWVKDVHHKMHLLQFPFLFSDVLHYTCWLLLAVCHGKYL